MADTTPSCTAEHDLPDRYMVLDDRETWAPLKGSMIIEITPDLDGDDIDAAIKARCRENDTGEGAGITVLYTAHGYELGLAEDQGTMPLSGVIGVIAAAPRPAGEILGERRTVVLEFLGQTGALDDEETDVADLLARASTEDLICDVKTKILEPLDGPTLARLATQARSDPGFFELHDTGSPLNGEEI
jgi:hypothetical protein